jgi:hypothetical protein
MRHLMIVPAVALVSSLAGAESLTERRMSSSDIGTVVFMAPEHWTGFERYDDLEAASVYELSSKSDKFELRLTARYYVPGASDEEIIERLDGYLRYAIEEFLNQPDRHEVRAARFGPRNHGIYARITRRNPDKDAYSYYTHGARILDNKFITFSLNSNDHDLSVLKSTLNLVTSVAGKNEWANAPDSYICNVEQIIGFAIVEEEWDVISSKKVKHRFVLRRSKEGDTFADTTEWVFSKHDQENANTFCDNDFIARGFFLCSGEADEEFRMNSKTNRFVYVYLGGYYDVPEGTVPDEESPKPQMGIGSCTPQ